MGLWQVAIIPWSCVDIFDSAYKVVGLLSRGAGKKGGGGVRKGPLFGGKLYTFHTI